MVPEAAEISGDPEQLRRRFEEWELLEAAAELLRPVLDELIRQAVQGSVTHNDDTGMRILQLAREPGDKRSSTFTSGIVSILDTWKIALFFTGPKHAGENIAEVLKRRDRGLPAVIQMCDALSRNTPKLEGVKTLLANCLAHGRRQFVEVAENFPQECRHVWKRSAMFTTMMHWRGNSNCRRKTSCVFIKSAVSGDECAA